MALVDLVNAQITVANVGDSRAIVVRRRDNAQRTRRRVPALRPVSESRRGEQFVQISTDHVCENEHEKLRILKAGGFVIGGLLNGHISMSRAIGDDDLKAHRNVTHFPMCARNNRGDKVTFSERLFISEPEVVVTPIQETDVALVIVSDGVWGTLGNERMANIVNTVFENGGCAKDAAKAVVRKAVSKGSRDNATAVVTCLSSFQTQRPLRQQGIAFSSRGTSALNKASSANSNPATQLRPLNNTPVRRKWSLRARSALTGGSTR